MPPRGRDEQNGGDAAPDIVPPLVWHGRPAPFRAHNGRGRPDAREAVKQANSCGDLWSEVYHYMLTLRVEALLQVGTRYSIIQRERTETGLRACKSTRV